MKLPKERKNAAWEEGERRPGEEPCSRGQRRAADATCRWRSTGDYRTGVVGCCDRTERVGVGGIAETFLKMQLLLDGFRTDGYHYV